jgi:hypothetical protein
MAVYQICFKERLATERSEWFAGLTLTYDEEGRTLLTGPVADQTALYSLLVRARDLSLTLISVNLIEPEVESRQNASKTGLVAG